MHHSTIFSRDVVKFLGLCKGIYKKNWFLVWYNYCVSQYETVVVCSTIAVKNNK